MTISTRVAVIVVVTCAAAVRLAAQQNQPPAPAKPDSPAIVEQLNRLKTSVGPRWGDAVHFWCEAPDRKSTRLNSSHSQISYAVFCLKKKKKRQNKTKIKK